jgi:hypothetical protein
MIGRMTGWLRGTARLESERGLALVLVIFALVILGAVVSGSFVVARFDRRAADNSVLAGEAQNAAETGLATLYATWDPLVHNLMPIWDGTPATEWSGGVQTVGGSPTKVYVDSVRRFNNELFLVRSFGARLGPGGQVMSQLAVAQLFRIAKPTIGVNAAITVQDPVTFNGNAFLVSGINANPPQWGAGECDPLDPTGVDDVVGVRSAVATGVNHPQDDDNVFGFPAPDAANDPTITSATFQNFLDYTYTTLASQPGVKVLANSTPYNGVAPVLDGTGACDRSVLLNLGEPWRNPPTGGALPACYPYFPVAHGTAAETEFAAGNRGQGVLLVDGDLKMTGGFEWVGLIIVRGKIHISGNGNKITGAILAEGADVTSSGAVSGDVDVQYSRCAIDKAIGGASLGRPLNQRSWLQVY